jgi:surface antigen
MKKFNFLICGALIASLVGCADMSKQDVGVLTGGAIGGLIGSRFGSGSGAILATVGGAVAGALIGGAIGHSMDKVDRMNMERALEDGQTGYETRWRNPDSGNVYAVVPTRTYYRDDQPCRDYTTRAIIGGKRQTIYGHACRMADGTWQVVN